MDLDKEVVCLGDFEFNSAFNYFCFIDGMSRLTLMVFVSWEQFVA